MLKGIPQSDRKSWCPWAFANFLAQIPQIRGGLSIKFALFVFLSAPLFIGAAADSVFKETQLKLDDYEPARNCGHCHNTSIPLTAQWRNSILSQSWIDPLFQHSYKQASHDTGGKTDHFCPRCHTPNGYLTKRIPPPMEIGKDGISCDFCHTISGSTGIGNGAYISSPGKLKWGQYPHARSTHHKTGYSEFYMRSEYCGMCHDVFDPENPKLMEQATYSEWKKSSYPKRGIQCQHCMMNVTSGVVGASEAVIGPKRWLVFEHEFLGGHWEENLKKAALLFLHPDKSEICAGELLRVEVRVANVGCGHAIPTGRSDLRELWLEVSAKDSFDREVFSAKRTYGTVFADEDGKPVGHKFWLAKKLLRDERIGPEEVKSEKFSFMVPENTDGVLTLEASLLYRLAPQTLSDAAGAGTLPIITMNYEKREIPVLKSNQ